ncbi:MAG: NB-ARC domain-containing protein, partial [Ardenticatenaceae bacterium]
MSDLFGRESIKSVLRVWHDSKKLGGHALARLKVVESQRVAGGYEPSAAGYGLALRQLLAEAVESLRPAGEEPANLPKHWRAYFIFTQRYIDGRSQAYVQERLAIGSRMYYREQNAAFDRLADLLREEEQSLTSDRTAPELLVPFLAPPRPPYELIGRDEELRQLKERLLPGGSLAISALNGLPGVGKTALAIELTNDAQVLEHFPDGVLWAGLGYQPDVMTILAEWGAALGIPANEIAPLSSLKQRAQALYRSIGRRRLLLVVDDAWQSDAALALKVGGPNCAHLLTTRLPDIAFDFAGDGAQSVHELSEADGLALLTRFVPQVVANEPDEARALVSAVGGLPLALILMGKQLQKVARRGQSRRLRKLLNQLQQTEKRLQLAQPVSPFEQQPSLPADVPLSLLASIEISDHALDEPARHALRALSIFPPKPNTFSEEAALAVMDDAEERLDTLYDAGLIEINDAERYTLHKVICDYATLNPSTERRAFYRQASTYFADFAQSNCCSSEGYRRLDLEWSNIKQVLQWALEQQEWSPFVTCVQGLTAPHLGVLGFLDARGYWQDATHFLEQALKGPKGKSRTLLIPAPTP